MTAELQEFSFSQKGKGLRLLPTIGFSFGQPSVGWNFGQLVGFGNERRKVKAKKKAISLKYEVLMNDDLGRCQIRHRKLKLEAQKLKSDSLEFDLIHKLFLIDKEAFDKNELAPADYYRSELNFTRAKNLLGEKSHQFNILVLELMEFAHVGSYSESIFYDDFGGCFLENSR